MVETPCLFCHDQPSFNVSAKGDGGYSSAKEAKQEVPKVSVNAPDGSEKTLARTTASPPVGGSGFVKVSFWSGSYCGTGKIDAFDVVVSMPLF